MAAASDLLDAQGRASVTTAILCSHHGFRRDLALFAAALRDIARGDRARAAAVAEEWRQFRFHLHGHHEGEDAQVFPPLRAQHPALQANIERLAAEHRLIDPVLARGDRAFAESTDVDAAVAVIGELATLLEPHLALEEAELFPAFRDVRQFPPPPDEATTALFAEGFAWSTYGVHPDVLAALGDILPQPLLARLPQARDAFAARFERAWGRSIDGGTRTAYPALAR